MMKISVQNNREQRNKKSSKVGDPSHGEVGKKIVYNFFEHSFEHM